MSEPLVNLENVTVQQDGAPVLSNVSFQVHAGDFVYLIGKTGSGKSSLLRTLYADIPPLEGKGRVAGYALESMKKRDIPLLRRRMGIVFQDFQLLQDRDVQKNLLFVLQAIGWKDRKMANDRIHEVLERVGLPDAGSKKPHRLSGGEQQRIAVARALLNDPALIIADEPTGNLDPETSEGIMKLLVDVSKSGRAVLMATHDYALIRKFPSRILQCANGALVDQERANG